MSDGVTEAFRVRLPMKERKRRLVVVFEGPDDTGKTTLVSAFRHVLCRKNHHPDLILDRWIISQRIYNLRFDRPEADLTLLRAVTDVADLAIIFLLPSGDSYVDELGIGRDEWIEVAEWSRSQGADVRIFEPKTASPDDMARQVCNSLGLEVRDVGEQPRRRTDDE